MKHINLFRALLLLPALVMGLAGAFADQKSNHKRYQVAQMQFTIAGRALLNG